MEEGQGLLEVAALLSAIIVGLVSLVGLSMRYLRRPIVRVMKALRRSVWVVCCCPALRWLGWRLSDSSYPSDSLWAANGQFAGVKEGDFLTLRVIVHSRPSEWEHDGVHYGWRLDVRVGADRIVCFFPQGLKKTSRRYLRRVKGSQRVVLYGKVTSLSGIHSIYKNDWLRPT